MQETAEPQESADEPTPRTDSAPRDTVILGGVFDPPHNGHLELARVALLTLPADRVTFLPAGEPPHKRGPGLTRPEYRLRMLTAAVAGRDGFVVDDREIRRAGPSHTSTTLRELEQESPGERRFFLLGADNVESLQQWHEVAEVLRLCTPVAIPRPGFRPEFRPQDLPFVSPQKLEECNRWRLPMVPVDISSSELRQRVADGDPITDYVPAAVAEYIRETGLYR